MELVSSAQATRPAGATLVEPDLRNKAYRVPQYAVDPIPVYRADQFGLEYGAHHWPMLVGADFAAKTNSVNPFDLLDLYNSQPH